MKIITGQHIRDLRTVWLDEDVVKLIDQPKLPHEFAILDCKDYLQTAAAIETMVVRGAPAIGATACFGMAQGAISGQLEDAEAVLSKTRPTAYDLFDAIGYFKDNFNGDNAREISNKYADESAQRCKRIGEHGNELIKEGDRILTHCNAGALACVDWGTALSPMRLANNEGKKVFVWVDETRPRCQGARLTAWEMVQEGIEHSIIADNAAGYFMQKGEVDLCIVGADRVAANGDIANKIGTYEKAVLAKENGIPFYIAAPSSTIDRNCPSGKDIPIEERDEREVLGMFGMAGDRITNISISPKGSGARNPAFDVTAARYITGIITEDGVFAPDKL